MKHRLLRAAVVLSIAAIVIGCGRSTSVTTPEGGKANVTTKGDEADVTVAGPEGERATMKTAKSGVALPEDFPKDVPIPEGATPITTGQIGGQLHVTLQTPQPVAEVLAFYKAAFRKGKWLVQSTFATAQGSMIGATKDSRALSVTIGRSSDEDVTLVVLTVSK